MRLFVVVPAPAAEEEKDRLSVSSYRSLAHLKKRPSLGPRIIRNTPSGNDLFSRGDTPPKVSTIAFVKTPNAVVSSRSGNLSLLTSTEIPVGLAPMLSVDGYIENGSVSFGFIGSGKPNGQWALLSTSRNSFAKHQHSGSSLRYRMFTILALGPLWSAFRNSSAGICRHATCFFSCSRRSAASVCFCVACAVSSRMCSSSDSWIIWSFPDARNIAPSPSPSIITPTTTATCPIPSKLAIQSSNTRPTITRTHPTVVVKFQSRSPAISSTDHR